MSRKNPSVFVKFATVQVMYIGSVSTTIETIDRFVESERKKFETPYGDWFSSSFKKLVRSYQFLQIIIQRHTDESSEYIQKGQAVFAPREPGVRTLTAEEQSLWAEWMHLTILVHLEIESFYLFAKILLDQVAHALEFYFGPVRKRSLDSHDKLVKHLEDFSTGNNLHLPSELMVLARELKETISDHRDYQIAHEKSPKTVHGTVVSGDQTRMITFRGYPQSKNDRTVQTEPPEELLKKIDQYLNLVMEFVKNNSDRNQLLGKTLKKKES